MNWLVAIPFAIGAIVGMMAGRLIAPGISSQWTQLIFAGFAGLVAIGLVMKAL
jgi:uncharacterized membrane protein YfcA